MQVGLGKAFLLLVLYFCFVLMVLAADIWHRIRSVLNHTCSLCNKLSTGHGNQSACGNTLVVIVVQSPSEHV